MYMCVKMCMCVRGCELMYLYVARSGMEWICLCVCLRVYRCMCVCVGVFYVGRNV